MTDMPERFVPDDRFWFRDTCLNALGEIQMSPYSPPELKEEAGRVKRDITKIDWFMKGYHAND